MCRITTNRDEAVDDQLGVGVSHAVVVDEVASRVVVHAELAVDGRAADGRLAVAGDLAGDVAVPALVAEEVAALESSEDALLAAYRAVLLARGDLGVGLRGGDVHRAEEGAGVRRIR